MTGERDRGEERRRAPSSPAGGVEPRPRVPALLDLQRLAGNRATVAMVRRVEGTPTAPEDDASAIADPKAYLARMDNNWDKVRGSYRRGRLSFVPGGDVNGRIQPNGGGMNALLAHRLKTTLLKKTDGGDGSSIMERIAPEVEKEQGRQRDVRRERLREVAPEAEPAPSRALQWNYGAGSGTATSDIDVNLAGDATEFAVRRFNEVFRSEWGKDSGSVFDVNVYAHDYLPTSGAFSLVKLRGKVEKGEVAEIGAQPQSSETWAKQDVTFETALTGKAAEKVTSSQEVHSLVKIRKDMSLKEWSAYKLAQQHELADNQAALDRKRQAFELAETTFEQRRLAVDREAARADRAAAEAARAKGKTPEKRPESERRLTAENDLYMAKLAVVAARRQDLALAREKLAAGKGSPDEVERASTAVIVALHESSMYANEAYITGAAVLHVVGNLQLLKGNEKVQIDLPLDDLMHSANEQVGFIFDDLEQEHASVPKALLKAGKYILRLGHAGMRVEQALAAGAKAKAKTPPPPLLVIPNPQQLRDYGKLLMDAKDLPADRQLEAVEAAAVDGWKLAGSSIDRIREVIRLFEAKLQAYGSKWRV
jgi:hypothetical protein